MALSFAEIRSQSEQAMDDYPLPGSRNLINQLNFHDTTVTHVATMFSLFGIHTHSEAMISLIW